MNGEVSETIGHAEDHSERSTGGNHARISLLPVIVFVLVWLGGSWLVVSAWLGTLIPDGWLLFVLGMAAGAFAFWTLSRGFRRIIYPSALTRILVFRPFWYAMLCMPILATATLAGAIAGLPFGMSRVAGLWALGTTAGLLAIIVLMGYLGARRLTTKRLEVRMPRLPPALDGMRVVQISDLHVGPHTPGGFLSRVVESVKRERPDLIAITGDQVDDFARDVERFNEVFGELRAPLGVFAIPGNHDVYAGWDAVHSGLARGGFTVLVNDAVSIEHRGERFWVAGTGDPAAARWPGADASLYGPDIERTMAKVPAGEPVLALAHNPALWPALVEREVDLTLSGHTHYGQFSIPGRGWSMASAFLELAMGYHQRGGSLLYINPGTNYWGIPFRIGAHPEVTVLTLRAACDGEARISDADAS